MANSLQRDFDGYRVVCPLELGERASVWEAEELSSGRTVAIETLVGEAARDGDVREWFAEAWETAREVDHPGLVTVEHLGAQEGVPFAVRTPASGVSLAKRLAVRGPLQPAVATAVLERLGGALEAAHAAGLVHGALGPGVVVVSEGAGGTPDFHLSGFGRAEGDRREDVRRLGEILGALIGERRIRAAGFDSSDLDSKAGATDPPEAPEAPDRLSLALADVAQAAREGRYGSVGEVVEAANAARAAEPGAGAGVATGSEAVAAATPEGSDDGERSRSLLQRPAAVFALFAVVAVVVLLVTGGNGDESSSPEPTSTVATQPTTTAPQGSTTAPAQAGAVPAPIDVSGGPSGVSASSSDTVYVVTSGSGELSGFDQRTGERNLGPVDLGGGAAEVAIVDDSAWVTLPDADDVARVDLGAAEPAAETTPVGSRPGGVIGARGSIWVVDEGSAELSRIPLDGGLSEQVPLDAAKPTGIGFGLGSLWVSDSQRGRILRIDPDSPERQRPFDVGGAPGAIQVVNGKVWTADEAAGTVTELDPSGGRPMGIDVGGSPLDLAQAPGLLWASNGDGYVTSIDLLTGLTSQIDLSGAAGAPLGIAVGKQVWTTTGDGDQLVAVAPASE